MVRQTPLAGIHRALGAKIVNFAGWEMPLHYGSQIEEHHAVRRHAGMFDVSHMAVVDVHGAQAKAFLRRLLANDVEKLTVPGKALYSCMLNDDGGVVDDLVAYFTADNEYRLVLNAATCTKDLAWVMRQAAEFDVEIERRVGLAMIAVQGPAACALTRQVIPTALLDSVQRLPRFAAASGGDWFVARTGYTGEDGYELLMPATGAESVWRRLAGLGVKPTGLGARDTLRLEAGMALYGNDLDEYTSPLESGLGWTVAMHPQSRDFNGHRALQTQLNRGVRRKMVGLVLEGRGVLRGHQRVLLDNAEVGVVTSGTFSPTIGAAIALARVDVDVEDHCQVDIRGRPVTARVVTYPFVKNGQRCA